MYLDLQFFQELSERFGAPGEFARAYVVAHEIGHHVQNLLGVSERVQRQRTRMDQASANALSVRLELQADCYAGVWGYSAARRNILEPGDVEAALAAATAIGDDRLQKRSRGFVVPESFTHGSSAQRVQWFRTGLESGDVRRCDTFAARPVAGGAAPAARREPGPLGTGAVSSPRRGLRTPWPGRPASLHDLDQGVDVGLRRPVVEDAGAQREPPAQHGAGEERPPLGLDPFHQELVERVELRGVPGPSRRRVAKAHDRELAGRDALEVGRGVDAAARRCARSTWRRISAATPSGPGAGGPSRA